MKDVLRFSIPETDRFAAAFYERWLSNTDHPLPAVHFVSITQSNEGLYDEQSLQEMIKLLLKGHTDALVIHLAAMPLHLPEALVMAALSERSTPDARLIVSKNLIDPAKDLKIKDGTKIAVSHPEDGLMLQNLNSHCIPVKTAGDDKTMIQLLRDGNTDAILIKNDSYLNPSLEGDETEVIHLHPTEFIPRPGTGVLALLCLREHLELRRILSTWHYYPTATCTNTERKIAILAEMEPQCQLRAYCYTDPRGNLHCKAACIDIVNREAKVAGLSQSTAHRMAENIYSKLK
jgi:porphobilinogen deaminase